jgi:carboxyl-terminal processing protease
MTSPCSVLVATISLCWLSLPNSAAADEDAFDPSETIRAVVKQIENDHLTKKPLDNDLAQKWLKEFLSRFDPNRVYFLQSDIVEFQRVELADLAKKGDFQFPGSVRKRYRLRAKQALAGAVKLLAAKHDFSINEECPTHFDAHATDREQLQERWRLRIKLELLIEKLHGRKSSAVIAQLMGRYRRIVRQAREMTDERLCQIYLNSLATVFDPHSHYISPSLLTSFNTGMIRTYSLGLGFRIHDGQFVITSLHPSLRGGPAQKKLVGWSLIALQRLDGTILDLVEMHPYDFDRIVRWPGGLLKSDTEIILELLNPVTHERISMSWNRFPSF